jgi:hypothetical protein
MQSTLISLIGGLTIVAACESVIAAAATSVSAISDRSEMLSVYDREADAGRFNNAFRYAVAGCERLKMLYLCREVADLPLHMASQGIVVPPGFAAEQKRITHLVCLSGGPFINSRGVNISGFLCGHYARQFTRAHELLRERGLHARALQYFDSIHDAALPSRLYQAACKNNNAEACNRVVIGANAITARPTPIPQRQDAQKN